MTHDVLYGDYIETKIVPCQNVANVEHMVEMRSAVIGGKSATVWVSEPQLVKLIADLTDLARKLR